MIFNETPVRTSKNFKINNISIEDLELPTDKKEFKNRNIYINTGKDVLLYGETIEDSTRLNDIYEDDKVFVSELNDNSFNLTYEINKEIDDSIKKLVNQPLKIVVKENCSNANVSIDFCFDDENDCLIDNLEIIAEKNSRMDLTINYIPKVMYDKFVSKKSNDNDTIIVGSVEDNNKYFHRGILKFKCMEESVVNVTVINLLNNYSCNILSVDNNSAENSNLNFNIIDFGGKISISNYFSSLDGKNANNDLNTIYLGSDDQVFDLNYIVHCKGEKTKTNIEVQGALKDNSVKHFKGTIDFKKGCKKSIGDENESCLLLSDAAKSLALPMLLCSEEDVIGNHASSSGKVDSKQLFYLMTRGFSEKEAMKLLVKAKFNKIIENINNKDAKDLILCAIENKL